MFIFLWARSRKVEGFESPSNDKPYKFILYYADWCPHCHTAKPEFDKLGSIQTIGGKKVEIVAIEEKNIPDSVKVSGYPTVRLLDSEENLVEEYAGERTAKGFQAFLEKKMA